MSDVVVSERAGFLYIQLNRPKHGNSLRPETTKAVTLALRENASRRETPLGICFSSVGPNFCTGSELPKGVLTETDDFDFSSFLHMYQALLECELPLLGLVQGKAWGAGLGLASLFDLVLCCPNATFCLPEAKWGLIPGIITPFVIHKIGRARFLRSALTSEIISAEQALSWGIVDEVVPEGQIHERLASYQNQIQSQSPIALRKIKRSARLCQAFDHDLLVQLEKTSSELKRGREFAERVQSFQKKR